MLSLVVLGPPSPSALACIGLEHASDEVNVNRFKGKKEKTNQERRRKMQKLEMTWPSFVYPPIFSYSTLSPNFIVNISIRPLIFTK